jgi:hypothetical protein
METSDLISKYSEAKTEEEKQDWVKKFAEEQKRKKEDAERIRSLPEGKVLDVKVPAGVGQFDLRVKCPACDNVEAFSLYESIEIIPFPDGEYLGFEFVCIKCEAGYKIGNKQVFKALIESNFYE